LTKNNSANKTANGIAGDESGIGARLSVAVQQLESLKKEAETLRASSDAAAKALKTKEQELQEAIKARDTLQGGVTGKFEEFEKKATEFDNQRKTEIAELNKKIETINSEKTALAAKMDEELKKRDGTIEQLKKAAELSDKVLNEERQLTADLKKQLEDKTKILNDQITASNAEKENLKKELEAEKKKSADLAVENEALKKQK
jgi:chromosome segregation ATPase